MIIENWYNLLGMLVIATPAILLALLGLSSLTAFPMSERVVSRCTEFAVVVGLAAAVGILGLMLWHGERHVSVELGNWVSIEQAHERFHFSLKFVFDRLSIPFVILTFVLTGTIGAFASVYLHRETGFQRFFVFFSVFLMGMVCSSLAGTIETLFLGWELVGLSSALLVAYFHERQAPVRSGLRVWMVYRVADAAFLVAAIALHHLTGEGDFAGLMGSGPWPMGAASLTSSQAFFVGVLLLVAAAGKSALIPFSGWLPRAMEGPTPSSAIFYGALSVHLGAFLLLRVSPILELSWPLCALVVSLGIATAVYAAVTARVQTDVKSALAFASLTQVGIIVAEIGLGFRYIALIHIVGHACLRSLQLLRAPTLLRDYHALENALGERLSHLRELESSSVPAHVRLWIYRFALERGYFDGFLSEYIVDPFVNSFRKFDELERRWTDFLAGKSSRESDLIGVAPDSSERFQ